YRPYGQKESVKPAEAPVNQSRPKAENVQPKKAPANNDFGGTMVFNTKKAAPKSAAPSRPQGRAAAPTGANAKRATQPRKAAPKSVPLSAEKPAKAVNKPQKSRAKKPELPKTKAQKAREESRYNFVKGLLALCVCVTFITMLTVTVSSVALATINDILAINKSATNPVSVEIPAEADFEQVFDILNANGLVRQPIVTKLFLKFRHYDEITKKNKETGEYYKEKIQYQAGNYFLDINSGIEANIEEIIVRNNYAKDTVRLTFPEGWSIARIFKKIESSNVCTADKLYANLDIVGKQYSFIKEIEAESGRYLKAEGYLFPDTYDFYIGENASSVLKKLFGNFESRWTDAYEAQLKKLGMSMDEIVTIASIIQREAKDHTQMKDISSVIHNRLKDKATYPSIDMNSTKDYVVSMKEFNLFNDFYYDLYLESYNTYSNEGLPPGPICSPGKSAIEAALFPSDTDYHFFCHSESGDVYYAVTAAEHQANTNKIIYGGLNND
ncbi:MAG: endolytic transglycosylase MltG, partial [Clostridia bacterium]|nr:endolytic transglycosylase MltG [Clostridia bacterium]